MSNLVTVCGLLATDPEFCHHVIETNRDQARADGFLVPAGVEPRDWPIRMHDGWWLLTDDGNRMPTDPTGHNP